MRVLIPLPARDFDPTESAVPWHQLSSHGHEVVFATESGRPGEADARVLTGRGFGPLSGMLRARIDARDLYAQMASSESFRFPKPFSELDDSFEAIVLPGGHAPGMRPYLESEQLQRLIGVHLGANKPLGAICHGVLLAARAGGPRSALWGRRTTALLKTQELSAWAMTRLWLGDYYRTYPETVQDEVTRRIGASGQFVVGPLAVRRDGADDLGPGFALRDDNYVSARWPGDAYRFSDELCSLLSGSST